MLFRSSSVNSDGTFTLAAGVKEFQVIVQTNDDSFLEGNESFELQAKLADQNGRGSWTAGSSTITDNDQVIVSVSGVTVEEGQDATFTVTLSEELEESADRLFDLKLFSGGANNDANRKDYNDNLGDLQVVWDGGSSSVNSDGTFTLAAGVKEFQVIVQTNDD